MKFVEVFIKNNISKIDILYTYSTDFDLKPGMRVLVPFGKGNSTKVAMVLKVLNSCDNEYRIKKVLRQIDYEPILTDDLIQLGFYMHERYLTSFNQSFAPIMPPGDFKKVRTKFKIISKEGLSKEDILKLYDLENQSKNFISKMLELKKIKTEVIVDTESGVKTQIFIELDENYLDKISKGNFKITDKQSMVIKYLSKNGSVKQSDLLADLKISNSPVKSLQIKNLIKLVDREVYRDLREFKEYRAHILNVEQLNAVEGVLSTNKTVSLLHGMTGSGKTEVYLKLAENIVKENGQVIMLVPEIGLTPQMIERFLGRFKDRVAVIHSKLSRGERYDAWRKIKNSEVDIVVGARSAVFAPFENLKLIIIDEEHDNSYRFHSGLRYDTIEIAKKRMELLKGKVVLGSATPDVTSYYKAKEGKYNLLTLNKRAVTGAKLPEIGIVDMREELLNGNISIFSESLKRKLENTMNQNKQAILFLNRRGFSHFISCRSCGHVINCDNCDISMTYHKSINRLRCHYCGETKPVPKVCPNCGSKYIKQFGIGTQKVEEECQKLFPDKKIIRMDRDTTTKKDSYESFYGMMKNGEADILIGTQMLAKGLDFENVTLVGVIAADLSLHISDYKAEESTFDLLTQVAGRAGRSVDQGYVVVQTYSPDNYSIKYSANSNYGEFYNKEIENRKLYGYPPFVEMINIYFSSEVNLSLEKFANEILMDIGSKIVGYEVQYSRIIAMPKIQNVHKVKFTLKVGPESIDELSKQIKRVLDEHKNESERLNIYIDVEFKR
ncbi:MAG: primosomal protein N' [Peptoniphilus sp.]|uniref:primosomal protein N' n=1 Tax=Peptoniphilus sp. TaxID=1971214 RepID=UPI002A766CA3|nr:primosomal protein N' [Peptoniphilus sp.]MDY2986223.1 primosomal protein N' [Peptoniphilus sp.]